MWSFYRLERMLIPRLSWTFQSWKEKSLEALYFFLPLPWYEQDRFILLQSEPLDKKKNNKLHSLPSLSCQLSPPLSCLSLPGKQWKVWPAPFSVQALLVVRLRQPEWARQKHRAHILLLSKPGEEVTLTTGKSLSLQVRCYPGPQLFRTSSNIIQ